MPSVLLSYRGPEVLASALVSMLTQQGMAVSWDPERVHHGAAEELQLEMRVTTVAGSVGIARAAKSAADKFVDRFPDTAIAIDGDRSWP